MRRSMSWLLTGVLSLVIVGIARPAAAQEDAPKVEVTGGWHHMSLRFNESNTWLHPYKGGFGEVAVNMNEKWGVVGTVGYNMKTITEVVGDFDAKIIPFLFGVRYSSRTNPKNTPFLQFLAGATRWSVEGPGFNESQTTFTLTAGGGINIKANDTVHARIGGEYIRIWGKDNGQITGEEATQGLRLTAGVGVGF